MTAAKLGNPAGEPVPLAALGGDLAEVSKKCHGLVICGCIAHEDQVLYLAPSGLSALGQRGQMLRPRLSLMLLAAATLGIRPLFGDAFSLLFYAAGCGPQFTGGATCAGSVDTRAVGLPASPPQLRAHVGIVSGIEVEQQRYFVFFWQAADKCIDLPRSWFA